SDKMVSTTSKMMDITLMPILAAVYDGHREPLTPQTRSAVFFTLANIRRRLILGGGRAPRLHKMHFPWAG
ncbi:hypothetical protein, partial [Paraburkholderia tropica]|uniref:hypothetical protein n=1 Tax=Paraburkholderia tropica TaxID=92647 RepID=UPI001C8468AA